MPVPAVDFARQLLDALVGEGLRHVVLCPGSRSAPLAYAALAASQAGQLTLHVRTDERSAAFLALGLAKLTRVPAAVITTSGTAVANLHPAVLEAHHALVPLLVLSADRPQELRGIGANQTTVQPGIFGDAPRWNADLPAPAGSDGEPALAAAAAREAWDAATGRRGDHPSGGRSRLGAPGPVHLNLAFREPLVPEHWPLHPVRPTPPDGSLGSAADLTRVLAVAAATTTSEPDHLPAPAAPSDGQAEGTPSPLDGPGSPSALSVTTADAAAKAPSEVVSGSAVAGVAMELVGSGRVLVVIGDLPEPGQARAAALWAASRGWPVVAEPFGDHPLGPTVVAHAVTLLASSWLADHRPEHVILVGRPTLSRPVQQLLRSAPEVTHLAAYQSWAEPAPYVTRTLPLSVLGRGPTASPGPGEWLDAWLDAGQRQAQLVAAAARWPSGASVARTMVPALPHGSVLFAGPSNPVRDLDRSVDWRRREVTVVANRGLAGIDGCIATASGLALAGAAPTYALVGDLTLLHDVGALVWGPQETRPDLTVVVVNDDGGGIFATLEPGAAELAGAFERVFATATGVDLRSLAAAYGVRYELAEDPLSFARLVSELPRGLTLVEVRLPHPTTGHPNPAE